MFWIINRTFLITCLLILDVLLLIKIQNKNNSTVVIIDKPKTISIYKKNASILGSSKITVPKPINSIFITSVPTSAPQIPTLIKTQTPIQNNFGNLLDKVNEFRSSKGMAPVSEETYTCGFANIRANEITSAFNHDGFSSRVNSKTLPYPSYSEIAENIAMNSDKNAVIQGWIDSAGHHENMLKNVPFACIGNSGNYYVLELWKP